MPLHSGTRTRLLARVVVASVAASLVVSTMQLPGVKRNVAQAAGVATVDSYATLGSSRYFTVADNSAFDITGNITMAAWVRPDSTCIAASYCMIINKERAYEVVISSGLLEFAVNNSSANWANGFTGTGIPIRADVWTHIAVGVSRSTNTFYIFINGSLLYSRTSSTDIPSTGGNSTGAFTIGGRQNTGTYSTFFTGGIDEVRVYNTAVTTAAAVQTMMNTWGPADAAGLVAYYDFNEGSGTSLVNTIASPAAGTNLTANGSPTWSDVKTRTTKSGTHEVLTFPRSYLNSAGGWTVPTNVATVDALVVAGGGGGGDGSDNTGWSGGGGGAGGMKTLTQSVTSGSVLPISVGGGGVRGSSKLAPYGSTYVERVAANGANSVFATTTATGGGGGGQNWRNGGSGGSGGGGGTYTGAGGTGISGEGRNGGAAMSTCCAAGGGGGAGGVGANATEDVGGNGGIGAQSSITGSAAWYAGGGAGRGFSTNGSAQSGGTAVNTNGLDGTGAGGGGGGGGGGTAYAAAGFGANGVVVVAYASPCTMTTTTLEGGVTQVVLTNPSSEMNCMSTWTSPVGVTMVDAVIVGGGGGGGGGTSDVNGGGGGGGAGGQVKRLRSQAISASTSYSFTVGTGGAGGAGSAQGTAANGVAGASSIAFSTTSSGGNAGTGSVYGGGSTTIGGDGGSTLTSAGLTQAGGANVWEGAAGGAGAGSPGRDGVDGNSVSYDGLGGNGGNGQLVQWFTGSCTGMFGGGGGGGGAGSTGTSGVGGPGGGGAAATFSTAAVAGTNNCGGGGGGGYESASTRNGASGGTGVVMFRYNYSWSARVFATGTVTVSPKSSTNMGLGTSQVQYFTNGEVVTAQLTSTNGNIGVTLSGSATVSAGTNNSTDVTVRGSQTDVNNTLNSATLTTYTQGPGQVTLRITAAAQDQTINGLTFKHSNGHFYANRNFGTGVTRSVGQASEDARSYVMGGRYAYLATISVAAEDSFILNSVRMSGTEAWIGLADDVLEGTFIADGPDLVGAGRYTNWASGEPNNCCGTEDYATYNGSNVWNDRAADNSVQYAILEIEPTKTKKIFNVNYSIAGNTATTGKASRIETVGAGNPIAVNQFDKSETMTVTVSVTAGSTISLTGISATAGANGSASVTFEGTRDVVNTALSTLTMTPGSSGTSTITVSYRAKGVTVGSYKYNSTTDSFYLLDSTTRTYSAAVTNAEASTFAGVRGFLATVLTSDERLFIKNNVTSTGTWVNGRDEATGGDATVEGQWVMDGNDAYKSFSSESLAIDGSYVAWAGGEPSTATEGCLFTNFNTDFWNDGTCTFPGTSVYEFKPYTVSYAIPVTVTDVGACTTTTTTSGKYTMQQVTPTGHCNWTVPTGVTTIDTFIQGGGGGGGSDGGTGGNGGTSTMVQGRAVSAGNTVNVYVGEGGTGGQWAEFDSLSGEDTFATVGGTTLTAAGGPGGISGPGAATATASTAGIGFSGGLGGTSSGWVDGAVGGAGKTGSELLWSGVSVEFGGGGGGGTLNGGTFNRTPAADASGGGAGCDANGATNTAGSPGIANRGGGGGSGCAGDGGRTQGGTGGTGTVIFRYATDPLDAFPAAITSLRALMTADSFQNLDSTRRSWIDTSGNSRHAATFIGSPSVTTVTGNGATETVRTLSGGVNDGLQFPTGFLSTGAASANDYTFFHIARYSGATRGRIFEAVNSNWLSGFWSNNAGVAYHNGWMSPATPGPAVGAYGHTNWVMSVDQPFAYRQNAGEAPSATLGSATRSDNLSINHGYYRYLSSELSDWNVAEVIVFSRVLTAVEIRQVESYLVRKYGLTGVNTAGTATLPLTPKSLATNKTSITASDRLNVTWAAPNDVTGITDYKLEYKKSADSTWLTKSHTASTSYLSDTVTGLDADTQYDFRVSAVDSGASNRPATATVNGTTKKSATVTLTPPASPRKSVAATISAAVTSSATGTVTFLADGSNITGCVNVAVSSSAASCSWTPSAIGAASLTATYSGDTTFAAATTASASSVTVTFGNCAPTVTVVGRFTLNRFLDSSSVCNYAALPTGVDSVDILVVGGGGGGGENVGSGGGGGGGYEANNVAASSANSFTVTVGAGGRAGVSSAASNIASADRDGGVGGNSSITWNTTTLTGTGGGAGQTAWSDDKCGGTVWNTARPSGGTGSGTGGTAGTGGQGGIGDQDGSGSGFSAQAGGSGFSSSITGTNFGGGGGGGGYSSTGGAGGAGGGASGSSSSVGGTGTANTGGGGGGGVAGCTSGGAGGSGIVIMRYANVPTISGQPTARTVSAGVSTTFAVTAAATGATLSYQWQKDGVDISGATSASYTIASPVVGDAGNFRVVVRNFGTGESVSSVTSSAVALGVNVASQTITFATLSAKTYGDAAVTVSPNASSGLPVTTVSNDTSVCTISGSTVTIVGAGTCSLTASQAGNDSYTAATSVTQTFTVSKKTLTLSGLVAANKVYDRATTATVAFGSYSFGSSVVGSDVVTLTSTSYLATFASVNVANGITVTVTGLSLGGAQAANYQLPSPITTLANITAKELTVTGVTASNKTYDGNTTATLVTTSAAVSGYISPDTATFSKVSAAGTFDSADVANDIVVRTTGFSISGGQSANYSLTQPTALANITVRDLVVTGITASNKIYDDTNTATLVIGTITTNKVGSDAVTVNTASATGTFADKNKADGITVQVAGVSISGAKAGNYNLLQPTTTANISARPVTVTGITVTTKVYDQTTAATLGYGSAAINNGAGNDQLTLSTGSVVSTFNDKTAAAGKAVTVSGLAVSGAESANYSVTQPTSLTGEITAKAVTVLSLTATNKTYNGTTAAAFTGTATLSGVISGDTVSVSTSGATATFDTKDQGTSKVVTVVGVTLGGGDAGNYAVTQPTLSANIDKKNLTVSGLSGVNRTYDRTVTATFTGTASPVGKVGSENVTVNTSSASATFADKTVADNKVVTLSGVTLSGTDSGNYTVTQPQLSANITAASLSVTGVTVNDKVYNGNTTATLTDTSAAVSGVIGADDVTLVKTGKAATFGTATVGNSKSVTVTGYTIAGTDAGNYSLTQPTGLSANITEASAGLAWSAPSAITYGTLLSATQLNATASVPGTFVYTPALGTKLAAGAHTLSVTFTPTSSDYAAATTTVSITIDKKALTITASSESLPYGSAVPTITPVYSGFITGESSTSLTAQPECSTVYTRLSTANTSQATSCTGATAANYVITETNGAVTVTKRMVTVTASSPSRAYGDAQGTITPSYSSDFQNSDTSSVVSSMSCGTGYTNTSAAGTTHSTFCNSGTATNYQFTYVNGSITVDKKTVAVTASSHSVDYGDAAPTVTPSYGSFANGDTSSVVSNMACTTSYSGTTPVASSGIATSCSAGTAANYQFTYTSGAITISKRALTVTASSHGVDYGDAAPSPTPSYSGWVNSQGVAALTTAPTCTTAYTSTTAVALSGIATSCSGGLAANYSFTFVAGAVTISKKSVAITASSPTVTYGDAIPAVTASYGPFVNGDSSSVVSNTSCSTVYVRTSNAASAPATSCSGATAANYTFTYVSGAVTVEKKSVSVTASSHSVVYGDAKPTVTPAYDGFVNSQSATSFTAAPTCDTTYTTTSGFGTVASTCSGGSATNYSFSFTPGVISVAKKTLTVTASSHSVDYGDAAPSPTPSYDGWVNSQGVAALTTAPTCTTAYTSTTAVASSGIATSCSGGVAANYSFTFVAGAVSISKKSVAITASSPTVTYGDAIPVITPSYGTFVNGDTSSVVLNTACATAYVRTSNVGSLPATSCSSATADNYSFTYTSGAVVIEKKTLTVTASSPSAAYGVAASTISISPLYSNWANSDTSSVIDTAPTCTTAYTNTSAVGSAPYTRCSGGSDNNYAFAFVDGAVQVGTATVTITAENKIVIYGTALGQSISVSGLANSDSVDSVVYTYAGTGATSYTASTTRPTVVGGYSITPSSVVLAAGSSTNYTFNYVAGTGTINKKPVVVTASSPTVAYGDSVPTVTPLYSSDFAYSETSSVVSNTSCSTVYAVTSNVGSAPATSCSGATAANYSFTYVAGAVNVQKKTLTVTASSPSAVYGVAANTISVSPLYSNWANSDTSSVIDTAPTCTTAYTNTSAVASAPYTRCAGGSDNNYQFSFVDGAVQVGAATVTITAENKTAIYGTALSQSISVSGLANSDSVDSVVYTYAGTGATSYAASTTRPTAVGGYSITPSAVVLAVGALSNYSFNYVAGTGTINKKGITVTASSPTTIYGASSPTITPIYSSDFAYGETSSVVSNTSCSTVYTVTSNVASAPATSCSGATAANYSFTYVDGAVNVEKKTVMVTASSHSVIYGDTKPTVTPSYDGFVNSQSTTAFTTAPTCDTAYTTTSGFGTVASTCSGGSAVNYSFSFTPGVISVAKKTLTVTAPSPTVTYGDTAPTLTATIAGWVNSETSTVLTTVPTCSTSYTNTSHANTAPSVTCTGAVDDNYAFTYVSGAFTINKAAQDTVTVSATDAQLTWQPGPSFATTTLVGAGGDGDGAFTYSVTSTNSVCSISGDTLTALTAGECKLTATKDTSTNYLAKTSSEFSYTIAKAAQTITFAALSGKTYGESSFTISLSASSGLVVGLSATAGVCSVGASSLSGGTTTATVSIVAAGSCTVTASQSGNLNYNSATAAPGSAMTRSFTIARKALTIQGATAANKVYDTADTATGDLSDALLVGVMFSDDVDIAQSGFTATFSDANAANTKTVSFAGVTLQGTKAANYSVAQPTTTANITQASAGLNWATPTAITYGATLSATQLNAGASVGGTYTYTPSSGTLLDAGTRTLSVTFTPTSTNFAIATTTVTLVVNQKAVTVTAANQSVVYGNSFTPAFSTTAFVGSDAASAVTYTYSGTGGTAYSASSTAPTIRGSYLITPSALALSVGNLANYDITYVDGTLGISQAEQGALVVTASSQSLTYSPNPSPATATLSTLLGSAGSGTGAVSYAVTSGNTVCSISSSTLTALTAGTCSVTVTRDADINFVAKTSDAITITIAKATQTLSFAAISDKTYGDANFSVTPTASSGLTVSLSTATAQVCDIPSALTIRIVNVGSCTVIATQSGNINYEEATAAVGSSTTRSFSVARKTLTVSGVTTVSRIYDGSTDATEQLQFSSAQLNGVVSGDTVSLNSTGASGSYALKNVDTNKAITISGLALQGTHAARYNVQSPSDVAGTVLQATVSTTGITVVTRAFNGTRTATISTTNHALSGVLGSDVVVLDNTNYSAIYDTATAAVSKSVTVSALALSGADAANYTLVQPMLLGAISKALATVSFSSPLDVVYDASPRTVSTSTSPSSLIVVTQYSGRGTTSYTTSTTGPTDAGNYTVAATINETNYLGSNSADFFVDKQLVPVALDTAALNTSFTGRARYVSASTTPSGKQVVVTYQGSGGTTYAASTYAPTNAGSYVVTATIDERNFQGTLAQTLSVAKASQAPLVIVNASTVVYGDSSTVLLAKGGTGNGAITYAKVSGPCSVDATTGALTTTGIGSCVVRATKTAGDNVEATTSANRTLDIVKAPQNIAFTSSPPSSPVSSETYTPTATSSAGLAVSLVITAGEGTACNRSGSTVTFVGSGVCEVTASQAGSTLYEAAASVVQRIEVGKINQAITFPQPSRKRITDPTFMLEASASSGLTVTYALTSGSSVCSLDANGTVSLLAVGTCAVTASQVGDASVSAANSIARVITVVADVPSAPKITSISGGDAMVTVGYLPPAFDGGSTILGYRLKVQASSLPAVTSSQCDLVARTCAISGLTNGTEYVVSLSAVNAAGAGEENEAPGFSTPAPVLEAVRNVAGQRNDATMNVTWEDPESFGDGTFDRYELSIREDGGSFSSPVTVQSVRRLPLSAVLSNIVAPDRVFVNTASTRQHTFTGLVNTKTYFVKIVTITSTAVVSRGSNTAAATLLPLEAPSAPLDVVVESSTGRSGTVSWKAPVTNGGSPLIRYTVSASQGSCVLATLLATKCEITGLNPGQSFSVGVRAVNAVGQSSATTESIVLPDTPSAPRISGVSLTGVSALVTWTAPSSSGGRFITSYAVSAVNASNATDITRCTTTALTCTINSLKMGVTYNFSVRARNSVGEGAASALFTTKTAAPVVAPPVSSGAGTTVWETYRTENAGLSRALVGMPPAPGKVRIASTGARTKVTATGTKTSGGPITHAIITISSKARKVLARISVRVSSDNPTATVTVPFKSKRISVSVQFANDYGVSTGGPVGVNVREGNTYDSTVVGGRPQLMGSINGDPVYFAAGSSALTPAGMKQLRVVAKRVKMTSGLVYVTGYSRIDEVRGWAVDALARARAETVAKYLAKMGVRQWIRFQGAGAMKSDWGDWRDRRVVVYDSGNLGAA